MRLSLGKKLLVGGAALLGGTLLFSLLFGKKAFAKGISNMGGKLTQTVGKHWILSPKLSEAKGEEIAVNYGWQFEGTYEGMAFEPAATVPGLRAIQGPGTKHNARHTDYSQTCVLVSQIASLKGEAVDLRTILSDPGTAQLVSIDGPILLRQPGVPELSPLEDAIERRGPSIPRSAVEALPDNIVSREAQILQWVEQGSAEFSFSPVEMGRGGLTVYVFSDALRIGGVRVNVTARLQQQIADRLGCMLLTTKIADQAFVQAEVRLVPHTLGASSQMSSTAWMVKESDLIDKNIQKVS